MGRAADMEVRRPPRDFPRPGRDRTAASRSARRRPTTGPRKPRRPASRGRESGACLISCPSLSPCVQPGNAIFRRVPSRLMPAVILGGAGSGPGPRPARAARRATRGRAAGYPSTPHPRPVPRAGLTELQGRLVKALDHGRVGQFGGRVIVLRRGGAALEIFVHVSRRAPIRGPTRLTAAIARPSEPQPSATPRGASLPARPAPPRRRTGCPPRCAKS